jgi:hypothetical protein
MKRFLGLFAVGAGIAIVVIVTYSWATDEPLVSSLTRPLGTHIRIQGARISISFPVVDPNGLFEGRIGLAVTAQELIDDPNVSAQDKQNLATMVTRLARYKGLIP